MRHAPCVRTGGTIVIAFTAVGLATGKGKTEPGGHGCCPQSTSGWVLFKDSNRRVPDFWRADSVVVGAIEVCGHGINFFFVSEEDGQPRYVALVIVRPTRELYEARVPCRVGDAPLASRLERARGAYFDLVAALEGLFGVVFSPEGRLDFTNQSFGGRPIISQCRGLALRWRETDIKLRGYLDVYMTMFS